MRNRKPRCPACGREFRSLFDYPRVRVVAFDRLPIPEAVDRMSAAAAEKWLARRRSGRAGVRVPLEGINMTPEIDLACKTDHVAKYLERLHSLVGCEMAPAELLPTLTAHMRFKLTYPVPGTAIYLAVGDAQESEGDWRVAEIQVLCEGPNMGSAGGPTLQVLGAIARLSYEGLLARE